MVKKLVLSFLCWGFLVFPGVSPGNYTLRRARELSFYSLIQDLKSGIRQEVSQIFQEGNFKIHLQGKYLSPVAERGEFSYPHAFVTVRLYKGEEKIGYFCVFPTRKGYRAVSSLRKRGGDYVDAGNLAGSLITTIRESFGIEKALGQEQVRRFNPDSFHQLSCYLAYYYYEQIASQDSSLSPLERFIFTVDKVNDSVEVSPEKIADLLSHDSYGYGNFSQFGLYYRVATQYPQGVDSFLAELRKIKAQGREQGRDIGEIENQMKEFIRSHTRYVLSPEQITGLLFAGDLLTTKDYLLPIADRVRMTTATFISYADARNKIISDIQEGKFGWLGVVDIDQLRKMNGIFSKKIMNFILSDIRKAFNYFLTQAGGFAFAYRSGDEIGVYIPEGDEKKIQEVMDRIRSYLATLTYRIFYLKGGYMTPEELWQVRDIVHEYDGYISGEKYGGLQLGIVSVSSQNIRKMLEEIGERLGRRFSFSFYFGDIFKEGYPPSFSGGIIGIKEVVEAGYSSPQDIFREACYRAQDTEIYAKLRGRNNFVIGYKQEYRHQHTGDSLLSDDFRERVDRSDGLSDLSGQQSSSLTPRIYNERVFRQIVYDYLRTSGRKDGILLWVCPRYNDNEGLHDINSRYTLQGGDDVIRTIAYFLESNITALGGQGIMIGRRIDRFFVFIPGVTPENVNYEKILEIFSRIQHDFEVEIPGIRINFDVYAAFSSGNTSLQPGKIFQDVMYAEKEARPLYFDLWGNTLGIFGARSEERTADIEQKLSLEAVESLVVEILTQRILPDVRTLEEIKTRVEEDSILRHISWNYIYQILEKYNLLPHQESFIPCFFRLPC